MNLLTTCNKTILATFAVTALSFSALSPALALDKDAFNKSFQSVIRNMPFTLSPSTIEVKGTNIIFHDTFASDKNSPSKKVLIGNIYFNDIDEKSNGYLVKDVKVDDTDIRNANIVFSLRGLSLKKLVMLTPDTTDHFGSVMKYETMQLDLLSAKLPMGENIFEMKNFSVQMSPFEDNKPIATLLKVENFNFNPAASGDKSVVAMFDDFGMKTLQGDIKGSYSWDLNNNGRIVMDDFTINVKDMGRLKLTSDLSGMTVDMLNAVEKLDADEKSGAISEDTASLLALSLMQQLSISSIVVHYDDFGFTDKMFAYQAKKQNTTPDTLKKQVRGFLPILASMTGSAYFAEEIKAASSAFIDNPKSLEISAKPEKAVSIASLIMLGSAQDDNATAKVIETLNLHIVANQ